MGSKDEKSDNIEKMTIPGNKMLYRLYDENNKAIADVITLEDEVIDEKEPYLLLTRTSLINKNL